MPTRMGAGGGGGGGIQIEKMELDLSSLHTVNALSSLLKSKSPKVQDELQPQALLG